MIGWDVVQSNTDLDHPLQEYRPWLPIGHTTLLWSISPLWSREQKITFLSVECLLSFSRCITRRVHCNTDTIPTVSTTLYSICIAVYPSCNTSTESKHSTERKVIFCSLDHSGDILHRSWNAPSSTIQSTAQLRKKYHTWIIIWEIK